MGKALLVMDMIKGYIYGPRPLIRRDMRPRIIRNIKAMIHFAHLKKIPVIFVNCAFDRRDPILKVIGYYPQPLKGSKEALMIDSLSPSGNDHVLTKKGYDGFWRSDLQKTLRRLHIDEIYLTGVQTDCCVMETGITAAHMGYKVNILEDCCDSSRPMGHEAAIRFMSTCVGDIVSSKSLEI